jgi:valyl-tRNA synthetase
MSLLDKTFRPAEVEAKQYESWEKSGAFVARPTSSAAPYTIMMPPPNVTGSLHMGHALTFTLQDILVRYHRMKGRDVLWQPGTDHAGIATQMVVERQLAGEGIELDRGDGVGASGGSNRRIGREDFIERVWQWKRQSGGTIIRQLRRLGASPDWERERFTMDAGLSEAVRKVFVDLHRKGLIYRDKRLVNWDPKLHTAVSDLEVQQKPVKGHLWHLKYPLEGGDGAYIVVATTRPETMLGDTAVAVHPDDGRYRAMIGRHVVLPLVGRRIPIIADEHADPETGSGAVKITPGHDFNDFEVGRRHGLPAFNIFDADARLNDSVPEPYRGLDRYVARDRIVADLTSLELVVEIENREIVLPVGDRSGEVLEPWLTDQWYVDARTLAKPCIEAVEQGRTRFVPKQWENTFFEWMRNIQPWCISRQIWWGHQIPAWYGPDGTAFVELDDTAAAAAAAKHYGRGVELRRDSDVLDTWFSSALWPFSTLGWPDETPELRRYYPGDVLVTGFDIIFFWVARMMMMGHQFMGREPFREVYIHALVRDEHGQKMSKSKGNIIDPLDIIAEYGCDALRFTLAALAGQGRDIRLSENRIEGYRNFVTKLWNAARFCQLNECLPDPAFKPSNCRQTVNKWIFGRVNTALAGLDEAIAGYRYNDAANGLYHFVWREFCDWHLELAKPLLTGSDEDAKRETRAATGWVLERILLMLHPLMPFVTEELWSHLGPKGAGPLVTATWPEPDLSLVDEAATREMDWIIRLVSEVRAVRSEMNVPPGSHIELRLGGASPQAAEWLARHRDLVLRLARLETAETTSEPPPKGSVQIVVEGATAILPLAGVIDLDKERERLAKEMRTADGEIVKIENKLGNEGFVAKAPAEVVDEHRQRLSDATAHRQKLATALQRLAGV